MNVPRWTSLAVIPVLLLASCSKEQPFRKPVTKVTGKLTIDGAAPNPPAQVECVAAAGIDANHPTLSRADTDENGNFEIATYEQGDGVPPGDYVLTFKWQPFNLMSRDYGPDKLKGKYAKADKSEHKFSIKEGDEPKDLGTIDLKTK
jgi:hypothetical protein